MFVVVVVAVRTMHVAHEAVALWVPTKVRSREVTFLSVTVNGDEIGISFCASVLAQGTRVLGWSLRSCHRETVNCIFTWEPLVQGDSVWSRGQRPIMLRWEERHRVFWVSFVSGSAAPAEFRTSSVPAGVGPVAAGDAKDLSFVGTGVSAVHFTARTTCVLVCQAFADEMPPFPTLHTLYWLKFLLRGPDSHIADIQAVSDEPISRIYFEKG